MSHSHPGPLSHLYWSSPPSTYNRFNTSTACPRIKPPTTTIRSLVRRIYIPAFSLLYVRMSHIHLPAADHQNVLARQPRARILYMYRYPHVSFTYTPPVYVCTSQIPHLEYMCMSHILRDPTNPQFIFARTPRHVSTTRIGIPRAHGYIMCVLYVCMPYITRASFNVKHSS